MVICEDLWDFFYDMQFKVMGVVDVFLEDVVVDILEQYFMDFDCYVYMSSCFSIKGNFVLIIVSVMLYYCEQVENIYWDLDVCLYVKIIF